MWGFIIKRKQYTDFFSFLKENEYFFDKETIENYLLSLKVKPFTIFTGNSGTGKTRLSQLFAQYLERHDKHIPSYDEEYINLTLNLNKTSCNKSVFPIFKSYLKDFFPFDQIDGTYKIIVDDKQAIGRINLLTTLTHKNRKFQGDLSRLYSQGKHSVNVKIKKDDLEKYFSDSYIDKKESIKFDTRLGKNQYLPKKFFNYIPINSKGITCNIIFKNQNIEVTLEPDLLFDIKLSQRQRESKQKKKMFKELIKNSDKLVTIEFFTGEKFEFQNFKPNKNLDTKTSSELKNNLKENFHINNTNYKIIPVGANWTENRHIVGYYNVITNEYQSTPAYDLIKAANNSTEPYFLILDEMNLSHVERYFADFLSAIESGEKIPLYGEEELTLPENLFIIGTVNVDETTYMFSPKVLDRANVIEFETYSASDYMNDNIKLSSPSGNIEYLENPLAGKEIREYGIDELREIFSDVVIDDEPFWDVLSYEINSFQTILSKSGFDFGFRVINEIVRFMAVAWEYEGKPSEFSNWTRYFDACIKQKMLPKLHGSEKIIGETLEELSNLCSDSVIGTEDMVKYPESFKKLEEMKKILRKQRYVSFIN